MAYMHWRAELEVGHGQIDREHQSLVEVLNRLHAAMKQGKGREEIEKVLVFLKDYTVGHFRAEEALMMTHAYPEAAAHIAIHADLIRQVKDLIADHQSGKALLTASVLEFLEDWLVKHIMGEDKAFGAFLKSKGITA
ncbi:bacteriohemerythrin [Geothrix sp. PMB-07]|uniref:bacteriohemerythrin n=1 Tax=Geothrix sp. PMB-07 TaxID=3068640 RepID=UPI002741618E|nr:bacteriohemerythrin [Geothrix sp. PMB-07]WLT30204.1 bacteriohemerythrin [Geothrix sp. PMB-07]